MRARPPAPACVIVYVIAHLCSFKKTIRFRMGTGGAGADAAGEPPFTARTITKQARGTRCLVRAPQPRRATHVVGTGLCVPLLMAAEVERGGGGRQKQTRPVRQ